MNVHVLCEHPRGRAAAARLARRARAILAALGRKGELSVLVVGDRGIRRLNREWRGKDVATDVLSFPAAPTAEGLLGDVVISLDTAARVARAERRPVAEELDRYLVHGILHLLGFDHETPKERRAMAAREDQLLAGHGLVSASAAEPEPAKPSRPFDSAPFDSAPPKAALRSGRTGPKAALRSGRTGRGGPRSRSPR